MVNRLCVAFATTIALSGCGSPGSVPTPVRDCELHNTGTLVMLNNSSVLLPREVLLDGGSLGLLAYGNQLSREVSASVAHPVEFRSAGGVRVSTASPIVVQCASLTIQNTF